MTEDDFGWGTWTAERPAEFTHLATGLRLTPILYSDRAEAATDLPAGDQILYGHRGISDGRIEFSTCFEDTRLNWTCNRQGDRIDLSWACQSNGEWGLRFWVCLCLGAPAGTSLTYDPETGSVMTQEGRLSFEALCTKRPLLVTAHADVADLIGEFQTNGYFYLNSRNTRGPFLALRFNLDEAPEMSISVGAHPTRPNAQTSIKPPVRKMDQLNGPQLALQAVHDVLAWNHVYDPINRRPYTALTRNWSQKKFGGFGVWLNDILFHALLWSALDPRKSRQNVEAVFAHQTEAGNFPCLVTGNDAWLDRSQLPMASYVVWAIYRASNDLEFLAWAFPKLLANHRWWWRMRSLGDTGLVAYGTSSGPGDGLYKGTKLAARNESAMDNMPVHDEAEFDPSTGLLQSADVGLNALLALDGEVLSLMAQTLGRTTEAKQLAKTTNRHKATIKSDLWDPERKVFANRLRSGKFVDALAPTSFFPLVAGIASEAQVSCLVDGYLKPEDKFGGAFSLPSTQRNHPAFHDNTYWRGRVWAPLNYWVYQGLQRYGRAQEAQALASKSRAMFNAHWDKRMCGENYSAVTGEICDQADTDTFYTWGALLPALSVYQVVSDTPWDGLTINVGQRTGALGPLKTHLGAIKFDSGLDGWALTINGHERLTGTGELRLGFVEIDDDKFSSKVWTNEESADLRFKGAALAQAQLNGSHLPIKDGRISIPEAQNGSLLDVTFGPEAHLSAT